MGWEEERGWEWKANKSGILLLDYDANTSILCWNMFANLA